MRAHACVNLFSAKALLAAAAAAAGFGFESVSTALADDVAESKDAALWVADFDKAVAKAKAEKKDLLVDFTGSDWCGWCIRLHEEVFAHSDFLDAAQKDYVLVALDFPHAEDIKAKVPNPARNKELAEKYGVGGYPTVLLMTADGEVFGQTGYQEGGSENYITHIAELREKGRSELKSAKELTAAIVAAKPEERAALADKAIASLSELEAGAPSTAIRVGPVKAAIAADPENKAGIAVKAVRALFQKQAADASIVAMVEKMDPKNEQGLLEHAVLSKAMTLRSLEDVNVFVKRIDEIHAMGPVKDPKVAKDLAVNAMFMIFQHIYTGSPDTPGSKDPKDLEKAKNYARKVQALGIDADDARLKDLVDKVLASEPEAATDK